MCYDRDEEDFVACSHQGDPVEAHVAYRVHWMRCHLEDAIESQRLVDEVEEVSPIPGKVFNDSVSI